MKSVVGGLTVRITVSLNQFMPSKYEAFQRTVPSSEPASTYAEVPVVVLIQGVAPSGLETFHVTIPTPKYPMVLLYKEALPYSTKSKFTSLSEISEPPGVSVISI